MKFLCLLLFVVSIWIAGCATINPVPKEATIPFASPSAALRTIDDAAIRHHQVIQCTAKVSVSSPGSKLIFKLAVMTEPPDRIRIESIPVFGPPDFLFATQGDRFQVYLPGSREYITGAATAENLSRVLPLSLAWSPQRWVAVLRGRPDAKVSDQSLKGEMEGHLYRIDETDEDVLIERLWIDPVNKRLERMAFMNQDGSESTLIFSYFKEIQGEVLPTRIDIEAGNGTQINIVLDVIEYFKESENPFFSLIPPQDVIIQTIPD